jgi:hypothetical protein
MIINADFEITSAIIHDIPRGGNDQAEPVLTEATIDLDKQLSDYFRSKINDSLHKRGVEVTFDSYKDQTVHSAIGQIIREPSSLVEQSQLIAQRLHSVQTGVNPAGLLTVILGTYHGEIAVSVLKLEREEGIRFEVREVNGRRTVDLQFLRDLTLTNKTKVFKTSLFMAGDPADRTAIRGTVSDDQRGQLQGRGVADFYLNTFLGCKLSVNPAQATYEFVRAAEAFFNKSITNPEKMGRYQVALLSTMQNQELDIAPEAFSETHLDSADRPGFLDQVAQHGLAPGAAFEKDVSLVKVNGFKMTFENGMVLVGSATDLKDRVEIRSDPGEPVVQIKDAVKQLQGR